jgi:putative membrane protein
MEWLVKILLSSIAVLASAYIIPGVEVESFTIAIVVAVVISILNMFFKPIFILLTLPITVLTLGLFLLLVNSFLVLIAANLIDGFRVSGFFSALFFSFALSILQTIFNKVEEK